MRAHNKADHGVPPLASSGLDLVEGWISRDVSGLTGRVHQLAWERYRQYVEGQPTGGLSPIERQAAALRVAVRAAARPGLADDYRRRLHRLTPSLAVRAAAESGSGAVPERLEVILRFADLLAGDPHAARLAHLRDLQAHGLAVADIAALARLVSFVAYQANFLDRLDFAPDEPANGEASETAPRPKRPSVSIHHARNIPS